MKYTMVRTNTYVDSVFLMLLSKRLKEYPGVVTATVTMGTPMNLELLLGMGFSSDELSGTTPSDLVFALDVPEVKAFNELITLAEAMLAGKPGADKDSTIQQISSIEEAVQLHPDANIAIVSLPGTYAGREARKALEHGLHVMLFSDNVSLEQEIELKKLSQEKGLLMMGPDCGTAVIGGKPLCFANVTRRGPIGVIGASGTGLQEICSIIDRLGSGVSQAVGTGGRDLKNAAVGGATMIQAVQALASDPETKVLVLVSKPPAPEVAAKITRMLHLVGKPSVVHFIGMEIPSIQQDSLYWATNLEQTARMAVELAETATVSSDTANTHWPFDASHCEIEDIVEAETRNMLPCQRWIRGYYTGGTLADEAWISLHRLTKSVYSNNQTDQQFVLPDPKISIGHTIVDLGDDVFTVGRPHPMIEPSTRTDRVDSETSDPEIAVLLFDCVLGYGSHEDPAGALVPSICKAKEAARCRGGYVCAIASVTGTSGDIQNLEQQIATLRNAGVVVMSSNIQAVMLAMAVLNRLEDNPPLFFQAAGSTLDLPYSDSGNELEEKPLDVQSIHDLFTNGPVALNLGLSTFADDLENSGAKVVRIDWKPPMDMDAECIELLDRLDIHAKIDVDAANSIALERILSGRPFITGVQKAGDVVPGMHRHLVLHAGPPITWEKMCGPMQGAVIGALIYEGLAIEAEEARSLAASGAIEFSPCHHHQAVGPMAGIITFSMPVWVVENETFGNEAYATLNEGLGKVLRYGAYSNEVLDRLHWIEQELAPVLNRTLAMHGKVDLGSLVSQALQMGDEGHNRNRAGTSLLIRELAPHMVLLDEEPCTISRVFSFLDGNDHFFLNLSMAGAKSILSPAEDIPGSTVVTTMARNGTEFGLRVSGLGDRWFTGPAGVVDGLYLPGYGPNDAALDIGDSVITETSGVGAFAMAASPAIVKFVGGFPADAIKYTLSMYKITLGENREYRIPALDFRGTPTGIDLRKVVDTGILPVINTGIAHKNPGVGMVGAGLVKPPVKIWKDALEAFVEQYT